MCARRRNRKPISILCDLQGPKLRVGTFKEGRAVIRHSGHFTLDRNPEPGDETASACRIPSCSAS
jgi:pyruvate kinase